MNLRIEDQDRTEPDIVRKGFAKKGVLHKKAKHVLLSSLYLENVSLTIYTFIFKVRHLF